MSYRVLVQRSSGGEACLLNQSFFIASTCYKRKCHLSPSFSSKPALSTAYHFQPLPHLIYSRQRSSTARQWEPNLWAARAVHNGSSPLGRYISALDAENTGCPVNESREFSHEAYPCNDSGNSYLVEEAQYLQEEESSGEHVKEITNYVVVNFYVLVEIDDPQLEVARHTAFMKGKDIHGRILISSQGINAQYSGPEEDVTAYAEWVKEDPRFSSLYVQVSPSWGGHAFPRLRLRYKPSLVQVDGGTTNLPITDPSSRAIPLSAKEWKERLLLAQRRKQHKEASRDVGEDDGCKMMQRRLLLLDVRNGYEWDVGHFKGARRPPVDCFKSTEFGLQYNEDKEKDPLANVDKDTDVLMYCTGGIRCDVYSALLRQRGFKNLYSLKGGVARYLIEEDDEDWLGNLFVFDSRLSVPPGAYKQGLEASNESREDVRRSMDSSSAIGCKVEFSRCSLCNGPLSHLRHRNCANMDCNRLFLCCEQCAHEVKGCCCSECTSAPRQRPFFSTPQQYQRWHNYRDEDGLSSRPADHVGKRAKKRLLQLKRDEQTQSMCEDGESFKQMAMTE